MNLVARSLDGEGEGAVSENGYTSVCKTEGF